MSASDRKPFSLRARFAALARDARLFFLFPALYRHAARRPVDERKVVFVEPDGMELGESFRLLFRRLQAEGGWNLRVHALARHSLPRPAHFLRAAAMLRDAATARFVFLDDACEAVSCVAKRPGTVVVQLWHACGAFKRFGKSTAEKRFGPDAALWARHPLYRNTDLVSVSSPEVVWAYEEAMDLPPGTVRPLGTSRTDVFSDPSFLAAAEGRLRAAVPGLAGRKILLYAPTFRGETSAPRAPRPPDWRLLSSRLGARWAVLVKQHPFVRTPPAIPPEAADFAFPAPEGVPMAECLAAADACATDYSSLVFEYALLGRPLLFFAPDLGEYDGTRGFFYPIGEFLPGPLCRTDGELLRALETLPEGFDPSRLRAFRDKFMSACDGRATGRIWEAAKELAAARPADGKK